MQCCAGSPLANSPAEEAPFHALQLLQTLTELLPEWLPPSLFNILLARWRHPDRSFRCLSLAMKQMTFPLKAAGSFGRSGLLCVRPSARAARTPNRVSIGIYPA